MEDETRQREKERREAVEDETVQITFVAFARGLRGDILLTPPHSRLTDRSAYAARGEEEREREGEPPHRP